MIPYPREIIVDDPANQLPVVSAIDSNMFTVKGREFDKRHVTTCNYQCPSDSIAQVVRIKITAPSVTIDPLDKVTGFKVSLVRDGELGVNTLYPIQREHLYDFDFSENPSPTAAEIASEFVLQNANNSPSFEDPNYVDMVIDPTDGSGATLLLTARDGKLIDIFKLVGSILTVTTVVQGVTSRLTANEALRNFPIQPQINGGRPGGLLASPVCGSFCALYVRMCIPACDRNNFDILTDEGVGDYILTYKVWIANGDVAAFNTWIAALGVLVPSCLGACNAPHDNSAAPYALAAAADLALAVDLGAGFVNYPFQNATLDAGVATSEVELEGEIRRILMADPFNWGPFDFTVDADYAVSVGDLVLTITGVPDAIATSEIKLVKDVSTTPADVIVLVKGATIGDC